MAIEINKQQQGKFIILTVKGRIMSDEKLQETLDGLDSLQLGETVVCDLSELTYCNSTGLNFFIRILTRARKVGGDCVLVGLQPAVAKLFEISKLNEIFNCLPSLEQAVTNID